MATWLTVSNPGGFAGMTDGTFVVDIETGSTWGFHRSGSSPYTYRVTHNGVVLEGDYSTVDDALADVRAITHAHTLASYLTYS